MGVLSNFTSAPRKLTEMGWRKKKKKISTLHTKFCNVAPGNLTLKISYIGIEFNCMGTRNPWEKNEVNSVKREFNIVNVAHIVASTTDSYCYIVSCEWMLSLKGTKITH